MPIKTREEFINEFKDLIRSGAIKAHGGFWKWMKDWINLIDDYPDWLKEKIHGAHLPFGYEINISILMANRKPNTWDIIRKQGDYANSDPEDRSDYEG